KGAHHQTRTTGDIEDGVIRCGLSGLHDHSERHLIGDHWSGTERRCLAGELVKDQILVRRVHRAPRGLWPELRYARSPKPAKGASGAKAGFGAAGTNGRVRISPFGARMERSGIGRIATIFEYDVSYPGGW